MVITPQEQCAQQRSVAIVGGGIAGLYVAWRILHEKKDTRVQLFELADSVGGRIDSRRLYAGAAFHAELGAMRFRRRHTLLYSLVKKLELPTCPFDFPSPMVYLRGRRLSIGEVTQGHCRSCGAMSPFLLRDGEVGKTPSELVLGAIRKLLSELNFPRLDQGDAERLKRKLDVGSNYSAETWRTVRREGYLGDVRLYRIGFWNILQHYMSNEAFQLVRDTLSLESVMGNWNAAEAIPWFISDFSSDDLMTLKCGFSELPNRLLADIKSLGGEVFMSHSVMKVTQDSDYTWKLHVRHAANESEFVADNVVLALPKAAIDRLQVSSSADPAFSKPAWLSHVVAHRLFKLFLVYEKEWWMGHAIPGADSGRVFTDLPLRQVYYFSPGWMESHGMITEGDVSGGKGKKRKNFRPAMIMASYSDERYVSFWGPVLPVEMGRKFYRPPIGQKFADIKTFMHIPEANLASERMIEKVHRQLAELHGREDIPKPLFGIFRDWGADPFGGGWHTWDVGSEPWRLGRKRTELGKGLYLCGEAYSREQGWIEGALKTAECVLAELNIDHPSYLTDGLGYDEFNHYIDRASGDEDEEYAPAGVDNQRRTESMYPSPNSDG